MKPIGLVLVVLGILALVYGGFTYNREKTVLDVGPIHATATEKRSVPISPILGGIAIVGGLVMLMATRRRVA
ncbi:MAG: DUF3185 domain-containing protein [Candidatus Eisenbacteria bacterium]